MNNSLERIDPDLVPYRTLYTGAKIPAVGLGTFGSDRFTADEIAEAVSGAATIGYRHFDCAAVYGNEKEIGVSFQKIMSSGIRRDEMWITSKLWNDKHAEEDVIPACQQTLRDLQLEYLDLYLIHWPFPNHHDPGVDVNSRDPPCCSVHPRELHEDLAANGKTGRDGSGSAYRHLEYDYSKVEAAFTRCKHQTGCE